MLKDFIHLLYPPCCLCCHTVLDPHEKHVCLACITQFPRTYFERISMNTVEQVFRGRLLLEAATALWYFYPESKTQSLMHALKYHDSVDAGIYMGKLLGKSIREADRFPKPEMLIPVPLHPGKMRKRGYNQAEVIAKGMQKVLDIPINTSALQRVAFNESQTKKGRFARWQNVETIFKAIKPKEVLGKHVLLIDDVLTTGATLEACGKQLQEAGVSALSIATVAYTA